MVARSPVDVGLGCRRALGLAGVVLRGVAELALDGRHRRDAAARARWLQGVCAGALRVLDVRVCQRGAAPRGAFVAANHLGYLDILVLSALTPVVFVAKREVRGWPLFGWFAEKAGTRFIDRGRPGDVVRVADALAPLIERGLGVLVFLEGTSSDGREVLPFKSSLLEPATRNGWPVAAVGLGYVVPAGRSVENEVCWWGEMTLAPHLMNLLTLPWIEVRVAWGRARKAQTDRKREAAALRDEVIALRGGFCREMGAEIRGSGAVI